MNPRHSIILSLLLMSISVVTLADDDLSVPNGVTHEEVLKNGIIMKLKEMDLLNPSSTTIDGRRTIEDVFLAGNDLYDKERSQMQKFDKIATAFRNLPNLMQLDMLASGAASYNFPLEGGHGSGGGIINGITPMTEQLTTRLSEYSEQIEADLDFFGKEAIKAKILSKKGQIRLKNIIASAKELHSLVDSIKELVDDPQYSESTKVVKHYRRSAYSLYFANALGQIRQYVSEHSCQLPSRTIFKNMLGGQPFSELAEKQILDGRPIVADAEKLKEEAAKDSYRYQELLVDIQNQWLDLVKSEKLESKWKGKKALDINGVLSVEFIYNMISLMQSTRLVKNEMDKNYPEDVKKLDEISKELYSGKLCVTGSSPKQDLETHAARNVPSQPGSTANSSTAQGNVAPANGALAK